MSYYPGRVLRYDDVCGWGWHNAHDWIPAPDLNVKPGPVILDGTCRANDRKGTAHVYKEGRCVQCGAALLRR